MKVLLALLLLTFGLQVTAAAPTLTAEQKTIKEEALKHWSQRSQKESLENSLTKWEALHAAVPDDAEALVYLTRGNFIMADYFTDDKDKKIAAYEKAVKYGEKALALNAEYQKEISKGKSVEDSLNKLTKEDVPAIMWTAISLGKMAKARGIMSSIKYKNQIIGMVKRVEQLDPTYFHAAVPRYWGGFYALAPGFAGGDMKKSKEKFEEAIKLAPEYLGTRVLYAEVYWTEEDDKARFKQELEAVLASKEDSNKDVGQENILEKKRAEALLKKTEELF